MTPDPDSEPEHEVYPNGCCLGCAAILIFMGCLFFAAMRIALFNRPDWMLIR